MAKKRSGWRQDLMWRLEAAGWDLLQAIMHAAPIDGASAVGGWLGRRIGPLTSTHRTVLRNLKLCFPQWDEAKRQTLAMDQWENFGRLAFEFFLMDKIAADRSRIEIVGAERLDGAVHGGKPVIIVAGHFSNWEVMAAGLMIAGLPCEITYRAANNPYVDRRIIEARRAYGVRLLAPKGGIGGREVLEALKRGVSVAMMNDQKYDEGLAVPFFGHDARTLPAAPRLALRFDTVMQPVSLKRLNGARFQFVLHEPMVPPSTGDRARDMEAGVRLISQFIEDRVRERPQEWWWVHHRFPHALYDAMKKDGY